MRIILLFLLLCCLTSRSVFSQEVSKDTSSVDIHEQVEEVKGAVEGLQETSTEVKNILDVLRRIKVSGYLQAQHRSTDILNQPYSIGQFSGGAFPGNVKNQFQLRRGRLKVNYDNVLTQAVFQLDIVPTGVIVKDAYLSFVEPWLQSVGVQAGIFDRPFGYEVSLSSGNRESPERSRLFQTLFPGERDLGAKLFFAPQLGALTFLRADLGVFNGTGGTANEFDNFKDVIGRVGAQFPLDDISAEIDLGVSGYFGKVRNNTKDLFVNGESANGAKGFIRISDTLNVGEGVARRYWGTDVQVYLDVPSVGGLIVRGEYIFGKQPGTSSTTVSPATQPATALYKRSIAGWYVNLVQNVGDENQVILKYDVYDPNTNVTASDFTTLSNLTVADIKYSTIGLGFIHHWDATVKFVLYYEWVKNEVLDAAKIPVASSLSPYTQDVRDNVFTFRIQYKF